MEEKRQIEQEKYSDRGIVSGAGSDADKHGRLVTAKIDVLPDMGSENDFVTCPDAEHDYAPGLDDQVAEDYSRDTCTASYSASFLCCRKCELTLCE